MNARIGGALALCLGLMACATSFQPEAWTGGYSSQRVSGNLWWVRFGGNGYTTAETVQTYWLYKCAQLTLEQGFDGFRIVSLVNLTRTTPPPGKPSIILVSAQGGAVPAPYGANLKPTIAARIELLKKPFTAIPGRTFFAATLKKQLEPIVAGPKCGGNVCPYVHAYLFTPTSPE